MSAAPRHATTSWASPCRQPGRGAMEAEAGTGSFPSLLPSTVVFWVSRPPLRKFGPLHMRVSPDFKPPWESEATVTRRSETRGFPLPEGAQTWSATRPRRSLAKPPSGAVAGGPGRHGLSFWWLLSFPCVAPGPRLARAPLTPAGNAAGPGRAPAAKTCRRSPLLVKSHRGASAPCSSSSYQEQARGERGERTSVPSSPSSRGAFPSAHSHWSCW